MIKMMKAVAKKMHQDSEQKKTRDTVHSPLRNAYSINSDHQTSIIQLKPICPCDGGCPRCAPVIQPKLIIGQPDDKYEQEADRMADEVMRMPEPEVQRQPLEEEEEEIQTKPIAEQITPLVQRQAEEEEEEEELQIQPEEEELLRPKHEININHTIQRQEEKEEEEEILQTKKVSGKTPGVTSDLESHINSLKGGGQPLSKSERVFFESRFGYNFSQVRVHTDAQAVRNACALNAQAFTVGKDIVFGTGQYMPDTITGKKLLAHELTHVVQQGKKLKTVNDSKTRIQAKLSLGPISASKITGPPKQRLKKHLFNYAYWELDGPSKNKIFSLLRKHYATFKDDNEVREQLEGYLREDDRWYGLSLFHYGAEKNWPFPSRFLPPKAVPNTKGKLFEMLRNLADEERTPKLKQFIYRTFKSGTQDRYLALYLFHMGARGLKEWLITLLKVRTFGKIKKGKVFHLLRTYHSTVKGDKRVETLLKEKFVEDDLWYGLGLFYYGPEAKWPLPRGHTTPNTKGKFCHMLRVWRDTLLSAGRTGGKLSAKLYYFIWYVFQHGDRLYMLNLLTWGSERNWPKEAVTQMATKIGVQPVATHEITGYKLLKGKPKKKAWVKLSYKDIDQNYLSDCAFMAVLAAIARMAPKLFEMMIEVHDNGTCTVHFYDVRTKRKRFYVNVLPGFPERHGELYYAGVTKEKEKGKTYTEYWGALLEKAYAMWKGRGGGYWKLDEGVGVAQVFWELTGRSATEHDIAKIDYTVSPITRKVKLYAPAIGPILANGLKDKRPVVVYTHCEPDYKGMTPTREKAAKEFWDKLEGATERYKGIFARHAYALVDIEGTKVTLFNPHGYKVSTTTKFLEKHFRSIVVGPRLDKWV